ncbi:MAG TPA: hypothetical protein VLL54_03995 [Pyrinomonadaceae bacterium]|nr:hypothetical protein [Pyrinomonadaceae bacterium]
MSPFRLRIESGLLKEGLTSLPVESRGLKNTRAFRRVRVCPDRTSRLKASVLVSLLLFSLAIPSSLLAQQPASPQPPDKTAPSEEIFRLERVPVAGGAELITIHARLDGLETDGKNNWVPLVSVLRDTLGDSSKENDRLRYVWPLTYTRPTFRQRLSGAIPFLYTRVGNKTSASEKIPPPILDLAAADRDVWNKLFWVALQSLLLDPYGMPIKASTRSYFENTGNYRKSHVIRALSVLALYQAVEGPPAFSDSELAEIQARLRLTDKTFGGLVETSQLARYNDEQVTALRDFRAHNWELLRQRAEAESLVFEPLQMPDGSMTHALLWLAKPDLDENQGRRYDGRFLNIANPWTDKRLLNWKGYSETRYLDSENRTVSADAPGAREIEMIPLALYGLDHPKIPMVLVDFRDGFNPKKREMSRRALQDVTRNVLSLSQFGDLPYFVGRTVFDFVTGRRGMDVNQPSRLRTYSQLKLLLSLNQSLDPDLREQIGERLEKVSLNPMENDLQAEVKLANEQYQALLDYAKRPDGLAAKLDRDRRAELVKLQHGRTEQVLFRLANVLSFGKYVHRESSDPEMEARLDVSRRMKYHTRFLVQIVRSSPQIDVNWNLDEVRRSLQFIAEHPENASSSSTSVAANIFLRTQDTETRRACLETLSRINSPKARNELQRLSQRQDLDQAGKDLLISFLNPPANREPVSVANDKSAGTRVDQ